jgi:hypothetical protein
MLGFHCYVWCVSLVTFGFRIAVGSEICLLTPLICLLLFLSLILCISFVLLSIKILLLKKKSEKCEIEVGWVDVDESEEVVPGACE